VYSPRLPTVPLRRRVVDPAGVPASPMPLLSEGLPRSDRPPGARQRRLLGRYLAAVTVLLGLTVALAPVPTTTEPGPPPAHRVEVIQIGGDGLNGLTRTAMRATAWTSALAVDLQHDLLVPSPLVSRVFGPLAVRFSAWRDANRTRLATSVITAVTVLVFYGVLGRPARRSWARMILLLLVWSMLATYPQTVLWAASIPGQGTTSLSAALVDHGDPQDAHRAIAQEGLGDGFWTAFVTQPYSRIQTGSAVLAQAPPEQRAGLLGTLGAKVAGIDRRIRGGAALERALTALIALASAVPFAAAIAACSMAAWVAQTLLLLLCLTAIAFVPALLDARARPLLVRWWLIPLISTVGLTALASAASFGVIWLAVSLAHAGESLTRMLSGSAVAAGCVLLTAWRVRRWARRQTVPSTTPIATSTGMPGAAPGSEANVA
jgi:hypothetical protein